MWLTAGSFLFIERNNEKYSNIQLTKIHCMHNNNKGPILRIQIFIKMNGF